MQTPGRHQKHRNPRGRHKKGHYPQQFSFFLHVCLHLSFFIFSQRLAGILPGICKKVVKRIDFFHSSLFERADFFLKHCYNTRRAIFLCKAGFSL